MNKVVLITGASTGIGRSLSLAYGAQGCSLILMARRDDLLKALRAELIQKGASPEQIVTCVSDVSEIQEHVRHVNEAIYKFGRIDIAIANAGMGLTTHEDSNTLDKTIQVMNVNLYGAIATLETAKDYMLRQKEGVLVGVSSVSQVRGMATSSAYCASKAGLSSFLEAMRSDLSHSGVNVVDIRPGFVETPMTRKNGTMPWIMSADRAAKLILRAIHRRKARYVFPWQMRIVHFCLKHLPDWLYDFIMKKALNRAKSFKSRRD